MLLQPVSEHPSADIQQQKQPLEGRSSFVTGRGKFRPGDAGPGPPEGALHAWKKALIFMQSQAASIASGAADMHTGLRVQMSRYTQTQACCLSAPRLSPVVQRGRAGC